MDYVVWLQFHTQQPRFNDENKWPDAPGFLMAMNFNEFPHISCAWFRYRAAMWTLQSSSQVRPSVEVCLKQYTLCCVQGTNSKYCWSHFFQSETRLLQTICFIMAWIPVLKWYIYEHFVATKPISRFHLDHVVLTDNILPYPWTFCRVLYTFVPNIAALNHTQICGSCWCAFRPEAHELQGVHHTSCGSDCTRDDLGAASRQLPNAWHDCGHVDITGKVRRLFSTLCDFGEGVSTRRTRTRKPPPEN